MKLSDIRFSPALNIEFGKKEKKKVKDPSRISDDKLEAAFLKNARKVESLQEEFLRRRENVDVIPFREIKKLGKFYDRFDKAEKWMLALAQEIRKRAANSTTFSAKATAAIGKLFPQRPQGSPSKSVATA